VLNDPLEEILQKRTKEERFVVRAQEDSIQKGGCQKFVSEAPASEYYDSDHKGMCKHFGGTCFNLNI
jgi:hypothetical protein